MPGQEPPSPEPHVLYITPLRAVVGVYILSDLHVCILLASDACASGGALKCPVELGSTSCVWAVLGSRSIGPAWVGTRDLRDGGSGGSIHGS